MILYLCDRLFLYLIEGTQNTTISNIVVIPVTSTVTRSKRIALNYIPFSCFFFIIALFVHGYVTGSMYVRSFTTIVIGFRLLIA